ncbi:S1 family peptidase [Lampropedia puyangensis]|uniref:S1 family peptidase n=1 Tax=Lampropedia puyangensis TaxID=1330072 RepID=A0A4S8FDI0_9BURK|nr:S1 family peptidase [Lampropedia puyangensis]THU03972.1 S1 family peptidase [Lampropedia puyangensis]
MWRVLLVFILFSSPLMAQEVEFVDSMEKAIKIAGLEEKVSKDNLKAIDEMQSNSNYLLEQLGDAYAGDWIEYDENNNAYQVIAIAGMVLPKNISVNYNVKYILVEKSASYLRNLQQDISNIVEANDFFYKGEIKSFGVDFIENKISIEVSRDALSEVENYLRNSGIDLDYVYFTIQDGDYHLYGEIYGGTKIVSSKKGNLTVYRCTAGFNASIDIYPVVLTAGHCANVPGLDEVFFFDIEGNASGSFKGDLIGGYFENKTSNGIDAVLFGNANFLHVQFPKIYTSYVTLANVKAPVKSSLGTSVCSFGRVTGWRCGNITGVDRQILTNNTWYTMNTARFCGAVGDSGGPVVNANNNAEGIFSGAVSNGSYVSNCGPSVGGGSQTIVVYTSISKIINLIPGLVIKTQ